MRTNREHAFDAAEARDIGRRREIRRLLRVVRRREARLEKRRARLDQQRHLPFLYAGRALRLAAEGPAHQCLRVRLRLLHQPPLVQRAPRALLGAGGRRSDAELLSPQLHRGAVPLLRHHPLVRLHHGADRARRPLVARGARLQGLHPSEKHSGCRPRADRRGRAPRRPALDQCRAADRGRPEDLRAGKAHQLDPLHHGEFARAHRAKRKPTARRRASRPPDRARR